MFNNTDWMDRENSYPIRFNKPNPYVDYFGNGGDLFPNLHTFRITGENHYYRGIHSKC